MSEDTEGRAPGRNAARRRRVEGGRHHRHVVRVTPEEEAQLLALALRYRVSVPKLLVDSALAGGSERNPQVTPSQRAFEGRERGRLYEHVGRDVPAAETGSCPEFDVGQRGEMFRRGVRDDVLGWQRETLSV